MQLASTLFINSCAEIDKVRKAGERDVRKSKFDFFCHDGALKREKDEHMQAEKF